MFTKPFLFAFLFLCCFTYAQKDFYELRTYSIEFNASESELHTYLSEALLPALNLQGIKNIGVFEELGDPTPKKIYVLIPYQSMAEYELASQKRNADEVFKEKKKSYDAVAHTRPAFSRYTTSLYTAFDGLPRLVKPKEGHQLFELRTYEGHNEHSVERKVKMFNFEEFSIFEDTGLHSVFFGEQLAGPNMPALTYLISFASMQDRDANWDKFRVHPDWKRASALPEYANSVSSIKRTFLTPLSYSQL